MSIKESNNKQTGPVWEKGSLTVEAALVMPLLLYFILAFLYFIQMFFLQEQVQSAITGMGLNLAKTAYVYEDFQNAAEAMNFDTPVFDTEFDVGIGELSASCLDSTILRLYAKEYLDTDMLDQSCIVQGFQGMSFLNSKILRDNEFIDIVVQYKVRFPLRLFVTEDMQMLQRVRIRGWTGDEVAASYTVEEDDTEELVYITETGTVYHESPDCSHIKLSIREVQGIPNQLRNKNGARYHPCEICCKGDIDEEGTFYITSDGTRYHTNRECSGIKRNVKAIPRSEIGNRKPCKRCTKE